MPCMYLYPLHALMSMCLYKCAYHTHTNKQCGDESCTKALAAFGADINARNDFDMTPLDMALKNPQGECLVPLLVSMGCKRGEVVKHLLELQRIGPAPFPHTSGCLSYPPHQPMRLNPACKRPCSTPPINLTKLESVDLETLMRRRQNLKDLRLDGFPVGKRSMEELSRDLEREIKRRLELSQSLCGDEPFAIGLQQQEISRYRSRQSLSPVAAASDILPSPLEFRVIGGSRILCLDGGGIRGLIQIEILSEIERRTGNRITELFDWIIGTSTGGVIALGLVYCE